MFARPRKARRGHKSLGPGAASTGANRLIRLPPEKALCQSPQLRRDHSFDPFDSAREALGLLRGRRFASRVPSNRANAVSRRAPAKASPSQACQAASLSASQLIGLADSALHLGGAEHPAYPVPANWSVVPSATSARSRGRSSRPRNARVGS